MTPKSLGAAISAAVDRLVSDDDPWTRPADGVDRLDHIDPLIEPAEAARVAEPAVLDAVVSWLRRYIVFVNDDDAAIVALWILHTHVARECYTTPRLQADSPTPGSGKTTLMEHLRRLCFRPVLMASVSSPAMLARLVALEPRTMLIDEADRSLRPDKPDVQDLIAVLNSGYKFGATRPVLVPVKGGGWDTEEMSTFAPVALAGNDPQLPDDTKSRTIRVLLLPDYAGTADESDWEMIDDDAGALKARIELWAEEVRDRIKSNRPTMPEGITVRLRDKWLPLARVAATFGNGWPETVDRLALDDKKQIEADREDGLAAERPSVLLLRHLAHIWHPDDPFIRTDTIVERLRLQFHDAWGESIKYPKGLTTQRFGRLMVRSYKLNSGRDRHAPGEPRGYYLEEICPIFRRMGIKFPPEGK